MLDNILDFWEDHKKICIAGIVVIVIGIILIVVRTVNMKNQHEAYLAEQELKAQQELEEQIAAEEEAARKAAEEEAANTKTYKTTGYIDSLSYRAETDGRVEYKEKEEEEQVEQVEIKEPTYNLEVHIYDSTGVPDTMVDGSSCKEYLENVSLADFGTMWGTELTEDDYNSTIKYLVGVKQDKNNFERGDLNSVGWLMDNLSTLSPETAIKFTNLHVIGSLSSTHTAVLCSYDWYSAFGLKDTLVVFEDISGTLDMDSFTDGAIFYATVFAHNCKIVEDVNGQRVLVVQYNVFN